MKFRWPSSNSQQLFGYRLIFESRHHRAGRSFFNWKSENNGSYNQIHWKIVDCWNGKNCDYLICQNHFFSFTSLFHFHFNLSSPLLFLFFPEKLFCTANRSYEHISALCKKEKYIRKCIQLLNSFDASFFFSKNEFSMRLW